MFILVSLFLFLSKRACAFLCLLPRSDGFSPLLSFSLSTSCRPSFLKSPTLCTINQLAPPPSIYPSLNPLVPSVVVPLSTDLFTFLSLSPTLYIPIYFLPF